MYTEVEFSTLVEHIDHNLTINGDEEEIALYCKDCGYNVIAIEVPEWEVTVDVSGRCFLMVRAATKEDAEQRAYEMSFPQDADDVELEIERVEVTEA